MERMENKVSDQEAAEALNILSVYCEGTRCGKCIFRVFAGMKANAETFGCILKDVRPFKLRVIKEELRVVSEWEAINNEY